MVSLFEKIEQRYLLLQDHIERISAIQQLCEEIEAFSLAQQIFPLEVRFIQATVHLLAPTLVVRRAHIVLIQAQRSDCLNFLECEEYRRQTVLRDDPEILSGESQIPNHLLAESTSL